MPFLARDPVSCSRPSGRGEFEHALRRLPTALTSRGGQILAALLLAGVCAAGVLKPIDNALASARMSLVQRDTTHSLTVVGIDAPSLQAAGSWPWPRERFATAIENLRKAGANLIAFDVDFSASSAAAGDAALKKAVDADPGWIVLPTFVQRDSAFENSPLASISQNAILGSVNINLDTDGKVRSYSRGYQHGDHYHPTLGAILSSADYGDKASFLIDYGIRSSGIDRLSFDDVISNRFDPAQVRGRNILIGATALELGDEYSTPAAPAMSGVLVHALAYESMVQGRALVGLNTFVILAAAFFVLFLLWPRAGPIDLTNMLLRHVLVMLLALAVPIAVQALAPISIDAGALILAQAFCVWENIRRELARRATEIARQREAHLTHVAMHDPETLLPNRRAMLQQLSTALASLGAGTIVVGAIGIDRFATLRGAIGYARANTLVADLGERLAQSNGNIGVFHLSTSILGIFLEGDAVKAALAWESVLARISTRLGAKGEEVDVLVRAGLVSSEAANESPERLLERATIALDQARQRTLDCVVHSTDDAVNPRLQLAMVADVVRGVERDQFRLVYQPKVSARNGRVVGAEALVRWEHHEFGLIPPDLFIAVAEETGSIDALTRWALAGVLEDAARLRSEGVHIPLSVNLSARSLCDAKFCVDAIDLIRRTGADICFEITETALVSNPANALAAIESFHSSGVRISIDDYGSGLSSLSYLKQIAADELKLDKALVQDVTTSLRDRMILKSTIDLAHGLGMKVVAEGIEDAISSAALTSLGCDSLQGYHFGRPQPLSTFIATCREIGSERSSVDHSAGAIRSDTPPILTDDRAQAAISG